MNSISSNSGGFINVYNFAGYFTKLMYSYVYQGQSYLNWTDQFSMFYSKTITFPDGATDIKLTVWYLQASLNWEIFYTATFNTPPEICYLAYGYVWEPLIVKIPCNSLSQSNNQVIAASTANPINRCPETICCKPKRKCCCNNPHL